MIRIRIDQIKPSLLDHNYIERLGRVRKLQRIFSEIFAGGSNAFSKSKPAILLDLGGGDSPYKRLAQGLPIKWISVDKKKCASTDTVLDAQALPFKDNQFDAVICTQVFGIIPNLFVATEEIYRVLKPTGFAIFTEAAIYPSHPGGKWRILPEGWKYLLSKFSVCEVDADCKTVASLFRVVNLYLAIILQKVPLVRELWRLTLCPAFNLIGHWANERFNDLGFAANYIVIAKK